MPDLSVASNPDELILSRLRKKIIEAIKFLLEDKHLYQNVSINIKEVTDWIDNFSTENHPGMVLGAYFNAMTSSDEGLKKFMLNVISLTKSSFWKFTYHGLTDFNVLYDDLVLKDKKKENGANEIPLPDINIVCTRCKGNPLPHNPGYINQNRIFYSVDYIGNVQANSQIFFFPYQCQRCKGEPIIFVVRRQGFKLQLVGRSHMEYIDVPSFLPKQESKFYVDAVIAYNSGKILAAIMYLRTFIEQYMRRVLKKKEARITGEDLADSYSKLLDVEFPKRFKTLKKIYEELSIPLHAAIEDSQQFETSLGDIEKHFDALRIFPVEK